MCTRRVKTSASPIDGIRGKLVSLALGRIILLNKKKKKDPLNISVS